jgi:putative ABC transport system substrate-binding protein
MGRLQEVERLAPPLLARSRRTAGNLCCHARPAKPYVIGRRVFAGMAAAALVFPPAARAQQPGRTYRLGYLTIAGRDNPDSAPIFDAFFATLREHGFVEGKNLIVTIRASEGREERFTEFAAELVASMVDVIVTVGSAATLAAQRATRTIPIVFGGVPNPEKLRVVSSLASPGGNATGFSTVLLDTGEKTYELMREAMPARTRLGMLAVSSNPGSAFSLRRFPTLAQSFGYVPISADIRTAADLGPALERFAKERVEIILPAPVLWGARGPILAFAEKHGMAVVFAFREWVVRGALFSYGPDLRDNYRQVATYVAKVLNGAKPAELPVQQPTKLELVINLKTANALGIRIPPSLLLRADEVIE